MAGATIHAPCANHSRQLTDLRGTDLYLGFIHVKGLSERLVEQLVLERDLHGPFSDLTDFCNRTELEASQLELLIRIGAFRFTGRSKSELLWEKNAVFNPRLRREASLNLFALTAPTYDFPLDEQPNHRPGHPLSARQLDQAFDELELLGFPLCSPFYLSSATFSGVAAPPASTCDPAPHPLQHVAENGTLELHAYFVCDKVVPTVKGERMSFGCWLNRAGHYFDSVHFPDVYRRCPLRGNGVYRLKGKVTREFDFPVLEVWEVERLPYLTDMRFTEREATAALPAPHTAGRQS